MMYDLVKQSQLYNHFINKSGVAKPTTFASDEFLNNSKPLGNA